MTVNTVSDRITYQGDGVTSQFSFNFPVDTAGNIQVVITDAAGNSSPPSPSLFTIVLNPLVGANPTPTGGVIIYPTSGPQLPVDHKISIYRSLPVLQQTSLSNQSIIYPPVVEQALDYLTMLDQAGTNSLSRAFQVGPADPIPALVPPVGLRAGQTAFFDLQGNLVGGGVPAGGVFISAAMQPVVEAATLPLARKLMGVSVATLAVTSSYTITDVNNRQVIALGGNSFYPVVIGSPTVGFDTTFWTVLFNNDTRGKQIQVFGKASFILWPTQWVWLFIDGTGTRWMVTNPGRWQTITPVNFYVDPVAGADTMDGLAVGTGAFKTIQQAVNVVQQIADGPFTNNLANGTYSVGTGVVCNTRVVGANGYSIVGNVSSPNSVIIQTTGTGVSNGITVQDNAVVNVSGFIINSATGSNTTNYAACLEAIRGGVINVNGVNFGAFTGGIHMFSSGGGSINVNGAYHITGSHGYHMACQNGSEIIYNPTTITIDSAITCNNSCIICVGNSTIAIPGQIPQTNTFVNPSFVTGGAFQVNVQYNGYVALSAGGTIPNPGGGPNVGTGGWWAS